MLRILFFTDTHLRGSAPASRIDDFTATVKAKLSEVVALASFYGVAAVLHGGDLFDSPEPSLAQAGEFLEILRGLQCPLYIVPGNHDVYGHNPSTLPRTLLGLLGRLGAVRLLGPEPVFLEGGGVRVQLTGAPYRAGIDRDGLADYLAAKSPGTDFAVHVAHGMLLPRDAISRVPFLPEATAAEDVLAATEADVTLAGHYHGPWEVEVGGKVALNPGGLVRLTAGTVDLDCWPQVALLEFERGGFRYSLVRLSCARPAEEVIDVSRSAEARAREEAQREFLERLREFSGLGFSPLDPTDVLREVLTRLGAGPEVEAEVWARFQEAYRENGETSDVSAVRNA